MAGHLQGGFKNPILNLCIWCKEHVPLEIGRLCVYEKGAEARQKARFSPSAPLGSPQSLPRLYFMGRQANTLKRVSVSPVWGGECKSGITMHVTSWEADFFVEDDKSTWHCRGNPHVQTARGIN